METTTDGRFDKEFDQKMTFLLRSVVLGMGDGSMTTLTIADPEKEGIGDYLKSLPSRHIKAILLWLDFNRNLFRNPEGVSQGPIPGIGTGYHQNGVEYPSPYDFSIYTDYLKVDIAVCRKDFSHKWVKLHDFQALQQCIPPPPSSTSDVAQH